MDLFRACRKHDGKSAVEILNEMLSSSIKPEAIWAIIMHAASWHEQRTYDTPHSTILTYSIHRMIEELGHHSNILAEQPENILIDVPEEFKEVFQTTLLERLVFHLADVDHWAPEKGPRYGTEEHFDSLDNAVNRFFYYMRERRQMGALASAIRLAAKNPPIRLLRIVASLAAEKPDSLGHSFIMPISLLVELPASRFTRPHEASLWHLTEHLARKIPEKRPKGFKIDDNLGKMVEPTDFSDYKHLMANAVINYGILGHNGIFAHRIVVAASEGLVDSFTVDWLIKRLEGNIGEFLSPKQVEVENQLERSGTDWDEQPSRIKLMHSKAVRLWLDENFSEYWENMMDLKSKTFEVMISDIDDWSLIRAAQYVMASLYGQPSAAHIMIFTQGVWALADKNLISKQLATLQIHRMVREYLKGR